MLVIIPFQHRIYTTIKAWNSELSTFFNRLDELTVLIILPIAIREIYKNYKNRNSYIQPYFILLLPIFAISISGFISGMINENSLFITSLGTFSYIKYFLVIFIYAAFFREFSQVKRAFRLVLMVAVFLGVIAFIQELWALSSRYLLKKDIYDASIYILRSLLGIEQAESYWRLGVYRASSLMHHHNILVLYMVLIISMYLNAEKYYRGLMKIYEEALSAH